MQNEIRRLTRRAAYFFKTSTLLRSEVACFASHLSTLGPAMIIGGFLRDLYLSGNREFRSDIDFVVNPASLPEFENFVRAQSGKPNRFGGYGIALKRWRVDVWPLEKTWAATEGHVEVSSFEDLLKATFFDWDAILWDPKGAKAIHAPSYFQRLQSRVIDINLEPNPNPLGNAVRALRYGYRWSAAFGPQLAAHVAKQIRDNHWEGLVFSEKRSFSNPILERIDGEEIFKILNKATYQDMSAVHLPFHPLQLQFGFYTGEKRGQDLHIAS